MAELVLRDLVKYYGTVQAVGGVSLTVTERRAPVHSGPVGLRQIDDAAHDRRL